MYGRCSLLIKNEKAVVVPMKGMNVMKLLLVIARYSGELQSVPNVVTELLLVRLARADKDVYVSQLDTTIIAAAVLKA